SNVSVGGNFTSASGSLPTGASRVDVMNLAGHSADLLLNQLVVGSEVNIYPVASTGTLNASLTFDTGTLDATSLTVGTRTGTISSTTGPAALATQGSVTFGSTS